MKSINWVQILIGLFVGAILGIVGTYFAVNRKIAVLEVQVQQLIVEKNVSANSMNPKQTTDKAKSTEALSDVKPQDLIIIIEEKQDRYVRKSFGVELGQNFSDDDLKVFEKNNTALGIANDLIHDSRFKKVVLVIKEIDQVARMELLNSAEKPLHQTWAQMGKIGPEGQTEAGQLAEIQIAKAIIAKVKYLLQRSHEEITNL
jgi:hypothetical protein